MVPPSATAQDLSYKDKHWHEACFKCCDCQASLVDQPFASKDEKLYCADCHDNNFAARCDGCGNIFRAGESGASCMVSPGTWSSAPPLCTYAAFPQILALSGAPFWWRGIEVCWVSQTHFELLGFLLYYHFSSPPAFNPQCTHIHTLTTFHAPHVVLSV